MPPQDPAQACVICECETGARCQTASTGGDRLRFDCQACGLFDVTHTARVIWFGNGNPKLTPRVRAAMSHAVRTANRSDRIPMLDTFWMDSFVPEARLPSVGEQSANLIRAIGDHQSVSGERYFIDDVEDAPLVGAFNPDMFNELVQALLARGQIAKGPNQASRLNPRGIGIQQAFPFGLTLDGWERYEELRRGQFSGNFGFIAMKFNDTELEDLITSVVRPGIKDALGYDVQDTRTVARAGIIDNLMREQIRESAFVLVDLTHDNPGAYWEAGYAEGLGKPVIYICQAKKFDDVATHFDTNHCTTVKWSADDTPGFLAELVATVRRSLR